MRTTCIIDVLLARDLPLACDPWNVSQGVAGVLGAAALWWFKFAGDELRATVEETAAPVVGGMASAWQWLVDAILRLKERAMGEPLDTP